MIIETKHFNNVEINDNDIITFVEGIIGFEDNKRYVVLGNPEDDSPFKWLQSVDDKDLCFVIIPPCCFRKEYDFIIPEDTGEKLELKEDKDILIYSIVVIPEDISKMTANLKAPVIVNAANNRAEQIVLEDDRYSLKHYILEELKSFVPDQQG